MRALSQQIISEQLMESVAELSARVTELTRRLDLVEVVRGNGHLHPDTEPVLPGMDDSSNPIEFLTENGFVIVRPWETKGSPAAAAGYCRFLVTDPEGNEREVSVRIAPDLIAETTIRTNGRIDETSSFWICCAERHLADYVAQNDHFPDRDDLHVTQLDREEILLAIRWGKSELRSAKVTAARPEL